MSIRKIAQLGEPVLREIAAPVAPDALASARIQLLVDDLVETMRDAEGAGLVAPQVYESLQIVVIELGQSRRYPNLEPIPLITLVNPMVTPVESEQEPPAQIAVYEGCLSVSGLRGQVFRPRKVRVQALDRSGAPLDFVWEGFRAAVVQHEVDHLNGSLFVDRAVPRTLAFLREFERTVPVERRVIDPVR
jgi:peptide deformylase